MRQRTGAAATPRCAQTPTSLRVATRTGVCGVAPLGKGTTLAGAPRLASIPSWSQRITCFIVLEAIKPQIQPRDSEPDLRLNVRIEHAYNPRMRAVDTVSINAPASLRRGFRTLLVSLVLFCFVGLLAAEAFHHHKKLAEENQCSLCQVAAHQPFKATPPPAALIAVWVVLLYHITHWWVSVWIASNPRATYRSRAPPPALPGLTSVPA